MRVVKRLLLVLTVVAATIVPAAPASAAHRCGLEDVDPLVNALCEWHPSGDTGELKMIIRYLVCLALPNC